MGGVLAALPSALPHVLACTAGENPRILRMMLLQSVEHELFGCSGVSLLERRERCAAANKDLQYYVGLLAQLICKDNRY